MKEELLTDALLREFLLGRVNDEERERIENSFLTDLQTKDRVFAIEQDLVEDYLEDSLNQEDKESFLTLYAQTAEQRRELRITKSIKDWAMSEARAAQVVPTTDSLWNRFRTYFLLKPALIVPISVTVVIAVALVIVWVNSMMDQRRHLAVEQALVHLNSQSDVSPQLRLELRPGVVRSGESAGELTKRPEVKIVELLLFWNRGDTYPSYRAEVRRIGATVPLSIPNLQRDKDGVIRLKLYPDKLSRGDYQISLAGINSDGSAGLVEEYTFTITE